MKRCKLFRLHQSSNPIPWRSLSLSHSISVFLFLIIITTMDMDRVVVAMVKATVQKLQKEIALIRGLDKDAAKLTGSLDTIQKFLNDAEKLDITSEAVKSWLEKLENVAFDADDVLDELKYHILSQQIKATRPFKEKVLSGFSPFKHISRSRSMALKIKEMNENLESINKEAAALGLEQKLANEPALVIGANYETDSIAVNPIFIGRDNAASEIVEMLTNSITTDERAVSIISIVGMGGLGKTTLTRKVFNNKMVKRRFGSHIWVHVSPYFDPLTLYKKILNKLTSCQVEMADRQDILSKLQQVLKGKTYLLVLDDVWNEDLSKWEDFFNSLLGVTSAKGNAIVVTTRNMEVASTVNTLHIHQLKGLSEEECWSIIRIRAFGKEDAPYEFEAIGRKIASRCQGLPLAANVVGGILRGKSEEKWLSIEQKWLSPCGGGDNITRVLRLSFDNLSPPSLKKCFAYCAMFPKGSKIIKQKLIEFWMAEGFLQADGSHDDMESEGENFINVLLQNSLLQADGRDGYGNVESCGMHDLVHDLACSVSSSSNNTGGSSRVRYMALGDDYCGDKSSPILKHLRTLLMTSKVDISNINFSHCESLHVLRLDSEVKKLPSWIKKLIHLRDFDISKTWIEYLPDWIGGFSHLQTLRANSRYLKKLPSSIKYLINLRHLYISEKVELPVGIGRLTSLQTLKYFAVGDKNGCKIEELGSLNNLKGDLQILNLERVHGKEESEKANLFEKSKILNLCLEWDGDREGTETNDENVLEGLRPHSNLKKLVISGFNGKKFPLQTLELNKLMSLSLWCCKECEEIPVLGHLPNLKSICLQGLSNLKCINSSFYGMVNKDTRIAFPALESFKLLLLPKLALWAEIEVSGASKVKVFPRLQHLVIHDCEQLMSVPNHVSSCLEHLTIRGTGLKCLPTDWLFSNNQTLSELYIRDCPNLKEFRGSFTSQGSFASLWRHVITALVYLPCEMLGFSPEKLWLKSLSSLKNLPRLFGCLPESLRLKILSIIEIPRFPNLREVKIDVNICSIEAVDGILQGCRHSLYSLSLKGMEGWEYLPESIQHLTALSELWLNNFGMEELPEWLGNLSSLRFLYLYNCKWLRRLPSMDAMRCLTTLKDLYIRDCPELVIQSEATDSEWPKVSHIPLITIEGSNYIGADPEESEMRKKDV